MWKVKLVYSDGYREEGELESCLDTHLQMRAIRKYTFERIDMVDLPGVQIVSYSFRKVH